jgi:hypothetical protein
MVKGSWGDIEATGWKCQSCYRDLDDWWLPEDACWYNIDAARNNMITHSGFLNHGLHGVNYATWDSCIICSGDGPGDCFTNDHRYTSFSDCVEFDPKTNKAYYVSVSGDTILPVENFYWLDDNDGSQTVPLDCRSCALYQTSKCIPLRNAIDDLDSILPNIKDPWHQQSGYQISPCANWEPTFNMAFEHDFDCLEFVSAFKCYFGLNIRNKINLNREVTGKHYFSDEPQLDLLELLSQQQVGQ